MDEVTFQDVLSHYKLKLKEFYEEIETLKGNIIKMNSSIESSWSGKAADACVLKLAFVNEKFTKSQSEISEALVKLSSLEVPVAEGSTTTV